MSVPALQHLAELLLPAVVQAGAAIMNHYDAKTGMEEKADGSPVSDADRDAELIIVKALNKIAPGIHVIAEEAASAGETVHDGEEFFLVDPLDGTREFAARRPEFTVNIALIRNRLPVFGMIYVPATGDLYWTTEPSKAFKLRLAARNTQAGGVKLTDAVRLSTRSVHDGPQTIVASRSHGSDELEAWLSRIDVAERVNIGSSLKFCLVAEGRADLYPRFGPTMEWDTAAGHAIVLAAGGAVTGTAGEPFVYGKTDCGYRNSGFIVWSAPRKVPV